MTLGKRIKLLLHFAKISQRELALCIGISEAQISRIVNDACRPNYYIVARIAYEFGMTTDELLGSCRPLNDFLTKYEKELIK